MGNAKVLLVEDDTDLRSCLAEVLEFEGYRVAAAGSGKEAIDFFERGETADLVISDHYMRNGTGVDLLRYLRAKDPTHPAFFFITGQSEMTGMNAKSLGAQEFILKPFDVPELLAAVKRYLEKAAD
jgi:two-component system phosphate regulon response regulator PhoB